MLLFLLCTGVKNTIRVELLPEGEDDDEDDDGDGGAKEDNNTEDCDEGVCLFMLLFSYRHFNVPSLIGLINTSIIICNRVL